jgi:ornithine carbamoyltransferase
MWQRFTERARRVVFFAQEEAGRFGDNYVSTEHFLLGLLREPDSTACAIMDKIGVNKGKIKSEVERQIPKGQGLLGQDMMLTPRAKRVIDLAYDEARGFDHGYIGSEHLLLGLIREEEGMAGRILIKYGADIEKAREQVRLLGKGDKRAGKTGGQEPTVMEQKVKVPQAPAPHEVTKLDPNKPQMEIAMRFGGTLRGRDLTSIADLSIEEVNMILDVAAFQKGKAISPAQQRTLLEGKTLAMIFEKPSLRTRVSFEVGMTQLGGHAIYLQPSDIKLGVREPVKDVARNLDRMCDLIMARTFKHETVLELAKYSRVPVINALSDYEHPCQALADFLTIKEHKGKLKDLKLAFIGDGNNVAHSLMLMGAKTGMHVFVACPEGYEPDKKLTELAKQLAAETGAQIEVVRDPVVAAREADALYTDVWTSMGQEEETKKRLADFQGYQINSDLMAHAKSDAIVLHCLPAHRGEEITDEVMESPNSVVFDEAENRLHAQKAVMTLVVED